MYPPRKREEVTIIMKSITAIKSGLTIALLALFAACASPSHITLPDGTQAYRIDCDGVNNGMNTCFERAGKSCGADGYMILDKEGRTLSQSDVADTDVDATVKTYATDYNSILSGCDASQRLAMR